MARRPLATVPEIAAHYGVTQHTVRLWRRQGVGVGPLMFRIGRHVRARWDDIDKYDAQQITPQPDKGAA